MFFFTCFGLAAAVFIHLSGVIWFYYPMDRALIDVLYVVVGWTLAGLAMSAIIKPRVLETNISRVEHRQAVSV